MANLFRFDLYFSAFLKIIIPRNDFFNLLFSFFSLKGSSFFIWFLVIALVVFLEERKYPGISDRDKKFVVVFLVAFISTTLISTYVLKGFFRRPRPFFVNNFSKYKIKPIVTSGCPVDFSFPSSHAASAFAASTVLTYFDKKRRWFYHIVAVLISYSRIYLGCHYFFDVLGGAVFGLINSRIILLLFFRDTFPFRKKS